ncbi:LysR family transcriptional regulator [Clostridioides difficile]|nr:LysR family transcriptional regulator [Clostridioides difficile]
MDLLHLKYFQTVARMEHITKASHKLNIAQPALSKTISSLEKELGVQLFDRKGRYIVLNEYGRLFLKRVDSILDLVESSKKELQDTSLENSGEVKILSPAAANVLPSLLSNFRKLYPNITFNVSHTLPSSYKKSDFDLYISSSFTKLNSENSITLTCEEILLGVSINHPLSLKDEVYLSEVSDENFIVITKGENYREVIDILCESANFKPKIAFESDSPYTIYALIKSLQGVGFICGKSWELSQDPEIKLLHIKDIEFKRYLNLSWFSENYESKAVLLFKNFLINYFKNI